MLWLVAASLGLLEVWQKKHMYTSITWLRNKIREATESCKASCNTWQSFAHQVLLIVSHKMWLIIIIISHPLTMRVVRAPQMIKQPVSSIFPCLPLPYGTKRTPGLSIPWCCLSTSSSQPCLLPPFTVPCKMVLARSGERETSRKIQVVWEATKGKYKVHKLYQRY